MPVLVFIQEVDDRDPDQDALVTTIREWSSGHYTASFRTPDDLSAEVTRALHELELASAIGTADPSDVLDRAISALPDLRNRDMGSATLYVSVAGGPRQQVLRPSELENPRLAERLIQKAMFGDHRLFDAGLGTRSGIDDGSLRVMQDGAGVQLDELGTIVVWKDPADGRGRWGSGAVLVEESVRETIELMLRFGAEVLEAIDPLQRLTLVAPVALQDRGSFIGWTTQAERERNPDVIQGGQQREPEPVQISSGVRRRPALTHEAANIAEDLMVLIRRQIRS